MGITIPIIIIIFSSIILWKKCARFDTYSRIIGQNLNPGIRGSTINAIASSLPEFFVTLFFLFLVSTNINGYPVGLLGAIGTIFGSAIFNILVIPTIVIFIMIWNKKKEVKINKKILVQDAIPLLTSQVLLIAFLNDQKITFYESFSLIILYLIYVFYLFKANNHSQNIIKNHKTSYAWYELCKNTFFISIGCFLLVTSCEWLGSNNYTIPFLDHEFEGLSLSPLYVSLIFAAAASSVPDTIISARDAKKGDIEDSLANPIASNTFDICIALGIPLTLFIAFNGAITIPNGNNEVILSSYTEIKNLMWYMLSLTLSVIILLLSFKKYNKFQAFSFIILYVVFIYMIFN